MSRIGHVYFLLGLLNGATPDCGPRIGTCAVYPFDSENASQSHQALVLMQTVAHLRIPTPAGNTSASNASLANASNGTGGEEVKKIEKAIVSKVSKSKSIIPRETSGNASGMTAPAGNQTQEEHTIFAHAKYTNDNETGLDVTVRIAQPKDVIKIFICLYLPLSMAWLYYLYAGSRGAQHDRLFLLILQITVAALNLGTVLVNQSLSVLMKAPMTLTAMQCFSMLFFGIGITGVHFSTHARPPLRVLCNELLLWLPAAVAFGVFQLADHLEANYCSLSERTVFGNLAPVFGLILEVAMAPCLAKRGSESAFTSFASKAALSLKVFGATIFALQYPDFNTLGMEVSTLFVSTMVAYRLTQRFLLDRTKESPIALLTMADAVISLGLSGIMSNMELENLQESVKLWLNDPSIFMMLVLSFFTFSVGHWATLHLVKNDTATATMVIQNVSSGFSVIQGIFFFNDSDFQRPLAFVGILLVIAGGMWWTINQSIARYDNDKSSVDAPESS